MSLPAHENLQMMQLSDFTISQHEQGLQLDSCT